MRGIILNVFGCIGLLVLSACGGGGGGSAPATPPVSVTVPGAPTGVSAVAGQAQAPVSFTAPTSTGGATITSYTVTSSPGNLSVSGAASPLTVTGLTNGTAYTFTVKATNSAGTSGASTASNSVTPANNAEGFWLGVSGTGYDLSVLILENGDFYNIFSSAGIAYGIDFGTLKASGTSLSGNIVEYYIPTNTSYAGTVSGSFVTKSAITGSASFPTLGYSSAFSGQYAAGYETPATASSIAGTYTGNYYTGAPVTMVVSSDGSVLGSSTNCSFSGTVKPRPSGKNVYNVSMTFTGTQCAPGSGVSSGVAVLNTVGASSYIYTAGLNALKDNGFFWIGRKAL